MCVEASAELAMHIIFNQSDPIFEANVYSSNSGKILDHREKYFNFVVSDGLMPVRRDALRTANINFS